MATMIQVIGPSGSGKTRTLEGAIRRLRRRGLRVAVLKHSHHSLQVAGKDTDRLRRSGSSVVVFASNECVVFSNWDPTDLATVLPVDVLLIEGFRRRRFPGPRFVVRNPDEAGAIAATIARSVPARALRVALRGDGRVAPIGDMWELVGNLMRREGIHHLELIDEPPRQRSRTGVARAGRRSAGKDP
ncbi:MAG: molybdopterin-guanine dinucleotide biosynthesis protein B [Thermoplasmata archaeon]|jgi:molybdopterin-guanine dinucleotide biosynthesis protein B